MTASGTKSTPLSEVQTFITTMQPAHPAPVKAAKPSRLGRGLSSLMAHPVQVAVPAAPPPTEGIKSHGQRPSPPAAVVPASAPAAQPAPPAADIDGLARVPVTAIHPNPHQPRSKFDPQALDRLAESIRTAGVMQPIIVRPFGHGQADKSSPPSYELVAGERRWRAAQLAGLDAVPAIIRQLDDQQVAEWALIENLQREDLNAIERATAFQALAQEFKLSHDKIAQRVGVDRSTITNMLRLLTLHAEVQQLVRDNHLSLGQGRAIAALPDQQQQLIVAKRVIKYGLSVRQVESAVRELTKAGQSAAAGDATPDTKSGASGGGGSGGRPAHLQDLEQQIGQQLQTKVHIHPGRKKGSGTLTIEFYSLDQFDALLARLGVQPE
jgi:ParB family chromosome partitioning protein